MLIFVSEFMGTMLLILLGDGVVANVILNRTWMKGGGPVQITIGWGLAVMLPAMIFASSSGAHFNPALTLALALDGSISWGVVPFYVCAQFLGGFVGAVLLYIMFKGQFDCTEDSETKFAVFATRPSVPNWKLNFLSEAIQTFILVFAIKGLANVSGNSGAISNFLVFGIIVSIGMSLGGLTGYAINPARDLAPRFAHWILPIKGKGSSHWNYAWIPAFGPLVGAAVAALVFAVIPWNG